MRRLPGCDELAAVSWLWLLLRDSTSDISPADEDGENVAVAGCSCWSWVAGAASAIIGWRERRLCEKNTVDNVEHWLEFRSFYLRFGSVLLSISTDSSKEKL